jgi:hypothetical protein
LGLAAFFGVASPAAGDGARAVGLSLRGMSYVLASGTRAELVVEAQRAEVSPATGRIALAGVRARLGAAPGARPDLAGFELVCARGELDLATQEFVARGAVDGRTASGSAFETERLRYEHARGLLTSDAPVVWREGGQLLRGRGLEYWVQRDRIRLLGGASISQEES